MWKNHCVSSNPNFVILSLLILILLQLKLEQCKRGNLFPIRLEKDMNSIKSGNVYFSSCCVLYVLQGVLPDGTEVAVKQLSVTSRQGNEEFLNEVTLITGVQHRNLVKLRGCCLKGDERLLVYEFLANRSLHQALFGMEF